MKLSTRLRRAATAAGSALGSAPDPTAPAPPHGSPVAAYAGILDGRTLWLALEPVPGTLALREDSGEVHVLLSDLPEQDPAYRSVRADLLALPGDDERAYDVVVMPSGGEARAVWTAPVRTTQSPIQSPIHGPIQGPVPPAPGGAWQFGLARTDEGVLQVRRSRPAPAAWLLAVSLTPGGIHLTLEGGGDRPAPALTARDESGAEVARVATEAADGEVVATITADVLPADGAEVLRWGLGSGAGWRPVRRAGNDLADPDGAVLLPELLADDTGAPLLRLGFAPDGALIGRRPPVRTS